MILGILLAFAVGCQAAEVFMEPRTWQCDGEVNYYDAPIVFYFNASKTLCYAARKGCTSVKITKTYPSLQECLKAEYPRGRTISATFMCENQYYGNKIFTVDIPGQTQKFWTILKGCDATERFCPEGYVCFTMSNGFSGCCSKTEKDTVNGGFLQNKYSPALLN